MHNVNGYVMLELAIASSDGWDLFHIDKTASEENQRLLFTIVRTCVRAEEATCIVRSYICVLTLYSLLLTLVPNYI
jgi:hypothetical protein